MTVPASAEYQYPKCKADSCRHKRGVRCHKNIQPQDRNILFATNECPYRWIKKIVQSGNQAQLGGIF